jgi:hypothetical protein
MPVASQYDRSRSLFHHGVTPSTCETTALSIVWVMETLRSWRNELTINKEL